MPVKGVRYKMRDLLYTRTNYVYSKPDKDAEDFAEHFFEPDKLIGLEYGFETMAQIMARKIRKGNNNLFSSLRVR